MLPKKKQFIQEVVEPTAPEFLQEVVEPEVHVPEEPEMLVEEEQIEEETDRVVITSKRS